MRAPILFVYRGMHATLVAACGSVWQRACGSVCQRVAAISVLQWATACCRVFQRVAVYCSVLQHTAVCCSVLQRVAVCCSVYRGVHSRVPSHCRFLPSFLADFAGNLSNIASQPHSRTSSQPQSRMNSRPSSTGVSNSPFVTPAQTVHLDVKVSHLHSHLYVL